METTIITIQVTLHAPVEKVWNMMNDPHAITQWNSASEDWHTPHAENDLRVGGLLKSRMEAKDGSFGFDFLGKYTRVEPFHVIEYVLGDGREVKIGFTESNGVTTVEQSFHAENENPIEMQRDGWQAILNSFKRYVESH